MENEKGCRRLGTYRREGWREGVPLEEQLFRSLMTCLSSSETSSLEGSKRRRMRSERLANLRGGREGGGRRMGETGIDIVGCRSRGGGGRE